MKMLFRFSIAVPLFLAGSLACGKEKKTAEAATTTQDTMLLRDLAEANKNTAAANAVDNSLNTVRTSGDSSLPAMVNAAAQSRTPETRVVPRPPSLVSATGPQPRAGDSTPGSGGARQTGANRSGQQASSGDPCDSPAPVDQRSCLNRSIVQNDADLNRTYQDLLAQARKSGGADLEDRLRQSQREWVNTRDSQCIEETSGQGGSLWARARARCLADHSHTRTAELQRTLNSLRGQ
ncbi:MAG: eukaryotic-like serine/threonine-protein kinase [Gemmatimonadaceae bacterium]|nr:eukaryotic-like serine/threonine-protein kinase [Gemmatimonadaceae bacterium]